MFVAIFLLPLEPFRHKSAPLSRENETFARIHDTVVLYNNNNFFKKF